MTALQAWWRLDDPRGPDLVTSERDVDRLVGLLACQPCGVAARLVPHPSVSAGRDGTAHRELVIGVAGEDLMGSVRYVGPTGVWYAQGTPGPGGAPVAYGVPGGVLEFPTDALVALELIGVTVKDFLLNSGCRRPRRLPGAPGPNLTAALTTAIPTRIPTAAAAIVAAADRAGESLWR
jgi:hypothetical protein